MNAPPFPLLNALATMVGKRGGRPPVNRLRRHLRDTLDIPGHDGIDDVFMNIVLFDNALHNMNAIFRNCDWIDDEMHLTKVEFEDARHFFEDGEDYPMLFVKTNLLGQVTEAQFYDSNSIRRPFVKTEWEEVWKETSSNLYMYR